MFYCCYLDFVLRLVVIDFWGMLFKNKSKEYAIYC